MDSDELKRRSVQIIRNLLLHLLGASALYLYVVLIGCPVRRLTGVSCPFCGLSRACASAAQLNFGNSFAYYPLFPLVIATLLYAFHQRAWHLPGNAKTAQLSIFVLMAMCTAVYFIRLLSGDPVVQPDVSDSVLYPLINHFILWR